MLSHFFRKLGSLLRRSDQVILTAADGLVWRVEPVGLALFGPTGPDLTGWEKAGHAEPIKENLQRTIWRVRLPGATLYVKRCRANTPRSWAREVLRPAKARLEFENARTLRQLGLGAVEPLAWGSAAGVLPGDSYLITREQPGTEPFLDFLERTLPALPPSIQRAVRRQVARGFGRFLARLHDAGVTHPDPHPGNFLIELPASRIPRFFLTDLHAIRFGKPLSWETAKANLILLNRWFQMRASRTDRRRFWQAYLDARNTVPLCSAPDRQRMARELEQATEESNLRFWAARTARYRSNNRDSRKVRGPAVTGFAVRDLPDETLRPWLADPDRLFTAPSVQVLKDSRSSTVAELTIDTPHGPRAVIAKRFRLRSWWRVVKNLLRPSPALRSWIIGNSVRDRGLPTARPLAVLHRRRLGVPLTGYMLFDRVPDALELPAAVEALTRLPEGHRLRAIRAWAERLGQFVRRMHDRQVADRDLKAANVLMSGMSEPLGAEPVLIDLVGVEISRPVREPTRIRDLARLAVSFRDTPAVSRTVRLRVLRAYLGRPGDWKRWWREIDQATQVKIRKNLRTGRPLG